MDKLLVTALTLGCLSMALVYFSLQIPGEPEEIAAQAVERTLQPGAPGTPKQPDFPHSVPNKASPVHSGLSRHVYEI